jgi:membrane associated rhomboid family serine protease
MGGPPQPFLPRPTPGVITLLVTLTVCYALQLILMRMGFGEAIEALTLIPADTVLGFRIWQPVTSLVLHSPSSVGHLLNNALLLYIFGTTLEGMRGKRWLWKSFLWCGLTGSLVTVVLGGLLHLAAPGSSVDLLWARPVVGASGGALGLLVAWIAIHWGRRINLFLLGEMQAQTFGMIVLGIELLVALSYDGTASASHFGGMAMGFLIGRGIFPPRGVRKKLAQRKHKRTQERLRRNFEVIEGGRQGDGDDDDDDTAGPPIWGGKPPTVH